MPISGGTMIHGLPKRPVTGPPPPRPSPAAASSSRSQLHATTQINHAAHLPLPTQQPVQLTTPALTNSSEAFLSQSILPDRPVVNYRQFGPIDGVRNPHQAVELVRRSLVKDWGSKSILDSFLAIVRAERHTVSLWVFAVGSEGAPVGGPSLASLHLDEMHAIRSGAFTPADLFPCSLECTHPTKACAKCTGDPPPIQNNLPSACLLPRPSLRVPYSAFLDAVRDRLVDQVSEVQHIRPTKLSEGRVAKLSNGFVLFDDPSLGVWGGEWGVQSDQNSNNLVHCYLHVSLTSTRLLVQPIFRRVPLIPLPSDIAPGSPIVLLPYGAPAYFIGPYLGPTKDHEGPFRESLQGHGCRDWEASGFVVCWITVHNTTASNQPLGSNLATGTTSEERGLMAVWPKSLCLSSTSTTRLPLTTFPSIPSSLCPPVSPPRPTPATVRLQDTQVPISSKPASSLPTPPSSSVTEDIPHHTPSSILGALRSLTIDGNPVKGTGADSVALEMSSYVDYVVKEREREKERAAKEKENLRRNTSDRAVNFSHGPVATSSRSGLGRSATLGSAIPGSSRTSLSMRPQGSLSNPQGYYPSPPEVNSPMATFSDAARNGTDMSPGVGGSDGADDSSVSMVEDPPNRNTATRKVVDPRLAATSTPGVSDQPMSIDTNIPNPVAPIPTPALDSAAPPPENSSFEMDLGMELGMEDITEDDFDYFDTAPAATNATITILPTDPTSMLDQGPASLHIDTDLPISQQPDSLFSSNSIFDPHQTSSLANDATTDLPYPQLNDPTHPHDTSALPISPAKTPISATPQHYPITLSPQPLDDESSSDTTDSEGSVAPRDFPWRMKEYVPASYEPIPMPLSSVLMDLKYSNPGAKYCAPPSSTSSPALLPLAQLPEAEVSHLANHFITSMPPADPIPSTLPKPLHGIATQIMQYRAPGNEDLDALDKVRAKRRAETRKLLDLLPRHGIFEVWHSKKFIDKFSTGTDPRVKHVKRLRGQKRSLEFSPYTYLRTEGDGNTRSTWRSWPEFADIVPSQHAALLSQEDSSDDETLAIASSPSFGTDEDSRAGDRTDDELEKSTSGLSTAPRTPPPTTNNPDVPLGAELMQTVFHPNHLYPLATAYVSSHTGSPKPLPAPMSVPTPVSPAAHIVQGGEKTSLIEAAASVVGRELVENPAWAAASRALFGWTKSLSVSAGSVAYVGQLFEALPSVQATTAAEEIPTISEPPSQASNTSAVCNLVKPPSLSVGHSNSVLHVTTPSLRFWDKLGLGPLNGTKDVVAFALYEEDGTVPEQTASLSNWLSAVAETYSAKRLGAHSTGAASLLYPEGLVAFKWDSVKKTLASLIANLPRDADHVVIYVVSSPLADYVDSKDFRQLSAVITNFQSSIPNMDGRILFHFVPRSLVFDSGSHPYSTDIDLERFVVSVYDRLLCKSRRIIQRQVFKRQMLRSTRFLQSPIFTLARRAPRYSFLLVDWPPALEDAGDRHTFLHVAYQLSSAQDWLFIACVDERGEGHATKVCFIGPSDTEDEVYDKVARRVMAFGWEFMGRASVEWNLVITRMGTMIEAELIAWEKCIHREILSQLDMPVHVTITCADHDTSLVFLKPSSSDTKPANVPQTAMQKTSFQDLESTALIVFPNHRLHLLPSAATAVVQDHLTISLEGDSLPSNNSPYGSTPRPPQISLHPLASCYICHALPNSDCSASVSLGTEDFASSVSSLQLHILRTGGSPTSSFRKPLQSLLHDIARNHCALAVLSKARWGIAYFGGVPFHLAAVEVMKRSMEYGTASS